MHKEKPVLFTAPFMKKLGILPFPVDTQTMDLEGEFIQELMDSLKAGYDRNKPILIARSEDARIDGYPIDGRHRLYCMAKLKERGVPLPNPFPLGIIEVKDANELRALCAEYEAKNRSKGARFSKAQIEKNLKAIISDNVEVQGIEKMHAFLKSLGFTNDSIIDHVVDDYTGSGKKPAGKSKRQNKRPVVGLPESLKGSWTASESVLADDDKNNSERFDVQVSYKKCPDCDHLLAITTDFSGTVLSVKSTPAVPAVDKKK
jgi:hypothetical protein